MIAAGRRRGAFITLEGGEGAGKSTQVRHIVDRLGARGVTALATREPGGSPNAEILRRLLLDGTFKSLGPKAEAILFSAARIDHIDATILPALDAGTWVVCDRFMDSTRVYQGKLGDLEAGFTQTLERVTLGGTRPDLTLILDLPPDVGLARAQRRRMPGTMPDRFEQESLEFHQKLRDAFLAIASDEPDRCVVVDASQSEAEVAQAIWDAIVWRLQPEGEVAHG
jgi:dTMP kinase